MKLSETPGIDLACLHERFENLRLNFAGQENLIEELQRFVSTAADAQIVRVNPIQYAKAHSRPEALVIDLFLHARKAGLLTMEWQYVCRGCGSIVGSFDTLDAAGGHFQCNVCIATRETDLSDFVEVGFSVSKTVRESRFHTPENLSAEELWQYMVSANAVWTDGTKLRDFYRQHSLFIVYVEPGEVKSFPIELEPGFIGLMQGPELIIRSNSDNKLTKLHFTHRDGRPPEDTQTVAPGPLIYELTNASAVRIMASAFFVSLQEMKAQKNKTSSIALTSFLSGARLLSTQSFLDLFPSEAVMGAGGLTLKRIAFLFTDIQGSTALYERIGDLRAFDLVRQHFAVLRDVITANHGALVKTIGDAVMASFHEPADALHAALEMREQISRFNTSVGEELITLKIGAHMGQCLAVTMNGVLDYFGQTVNIAARVQGLAQANEICLTDAIFTLPGVPELLGTRACTSQSVQIKGLAQAIALHIL